MAPSHELGDADVLMLDNIVSGLFFLRDLAVWYEDLLREQKGAHDARAESKDDLDSRIHGEGFLLHSFYSIHFFNISQPIL